MDLVHYNDLLKLNANPANMPVFYSDALFTFYGGLCQTQFNFLIKPICLNVLIYDL